MPRRSRAVRSFPKFVDVVIDGVFQSTALITPLAMAGALSFGWIGQPVWAIVCAVIAVVAGVGVLARFVFPYQLRLTRLQQTDLLPNPGVSMRVVFFSDLHLGKFKRADWARKVVTLCNAQQPDVVLIGGDFAGKLTVSELDALFAPLADLHATYGVYAVLGNHDYGIPGPDVSAELLLLLARLNVQVLRDGLVRLPNGAVLVGLDEVWMDGGNYAAITHGRVAAHDTVLVLGHNPDAMLGIAPDAVVNPGRTLFLFGHTHHGQIRLPILTDRIIPSRSGWHRGRYVLPQGVIYVSAGLGENTTPTRFGTWCEVIVFDLTTAATRQV
jgi:uncharacterized protein